MAFCARYITRARSCGIPVVFSCGPVGIEWRGSIAIDLIGGKRWLRRRRPVTKQAQVGISVEKYEEKREKLLQTDLLRRGDVNLRSLERRPKSTSSWPLIRELADIMKATRNRSSSKAAYESARTKLIDELVKQVKKGSMEEYGLLQAAVELPAESLEAVATAALNRVGFHELSHRQLALFLKRLAARIPGGGVYFPGSLSATASYVVRNKRTFSESQLFSLVWAFTVLRGVDAEMDPLFLAIDKIYGKRLDTVSPINLEMLAQAIGRSDQYPCALALRPLALAAFLKNMENFSAKSIVRITAFLGEYRTWEAKKANVPPVIKAEALQKMGHLLAGSLDKLTDTELGRVAEVMVFNKYKPEDFVEFLKAMRREFLYRSASLPTWELGYLSTFLAGAGYLDARGLQQIQLKLRETMQSVNPEDMVQLLNGLSRQGVGNRHQAQQLARELATTAQERIESFTPGQCAAFLRSLLALESCPPSLAEELGSRAMLQISNLTATELTWLVLGVSMADGNRGLADELAAMADKTVLDSSRLTVPMVFGLCTGMIKLRLRHEGWLDPIAKFATEYMSHDNCNSELVSFITTAFSLLDYPCKRFFKMAVRFYEGNFHFFERTELRSRAYFVFACALNGLFPPVLLSHVASQFPENLHLVDSSTKRVLLDTYLLTKTEGVDSKSLLSEAALNELAVQMGLSKLREFRKEEMSFVACIRQICGYNTVLSDMSLAYFGHMGALLLLDKNNQPTAWPRSVVLARKPLTADDVPNHTVVVLLLLPYFEFCLLSTRLRGRMSATIRAMNATGLRVMHVDLRTWISSGDLSVYMQKRLLDEDIVLSSVTSH